MRSVPSSTTSRSHSTTPLSHRRSRVGDRDLGGRRRVSTWRLPRNGSISTGLPVPGQGSAHFAKLKQLAIGLMQSVTGDGAAGAKINLEQVKIGGETAGGLSIDAERHGGVDALQDLQGQPARRLAARSDGDLKNDAGKMSFSGNVVHRRHEPGASQNLGREVRPADRHRGRRSRSRREAKLDIDDTRFALTDALRRHFGAGVGGRLTITHDGGRERTDVTLQAADLDTRDVFPKTSGALNAELRKALGLLAPSDTSKTADALPGDMRLRSSPAVLTDGDETYRDVDVTFELEGSEIRLPAAKLTTANGLTIGLEGRVKTGTGSPVGTLAYDLVAPTPDAMRDLARKTGLEAVFGERAIQRPQGGQDSPGLMQLGLRAPQTIDVTFDGTLNGAHLSGSGEFDGGLSAWRSRPSRIQMTFDASSLPVLLAALGRDAPKAASGISAPAKAPSSRREPSAPALTRVEIDVAGIGDDVRRTYALAGRRGLALNGAVDVKAADYPMRCPCRPVAADRRCRHRDARHA